MQNVITHDGLTIDFSKVRSVLAPSGYPVWAGVVTLVFRDTVDRTVTKITANFTGDLLVDVEGDPEDGDSIYKFCEMFEEDWAAEISAKIGKPSYARAKA